VYQAGEFIYVRNLSSVEIAPILCDYQLGIAEAAHDLHDIQISHLLLSSCLTAALALPPVACVSAAM
jgi:hypothetical protein